MVPLWVPLLIFLCYFVCMAKDNRATPRLSAEALLYLDDLTKTGLYGNSIDGAARALIEQGIRQAITDGHISPRIADPNSTENE